MDLMKLMKQANNLKKMQGEISKTIVTDEINGAKLVLSGKGEVKNFEISQELYDKGKDEVNKAAKSVIESCLKKQMDLYKSKAKDAMGGMDLSGMMG